MKFHNPSTVQPTWIPNLDLAGSGELQYPFIERDKWVWVLQLIYPRKCRIGQSTHAVPIVKMLPITDPHNVNVSDWSITAMSTWSDGKFTECFYWGNWGVQYSTQWILHSKVVMWCICLFMSSFKPHHNDSIAWIYVSCIGKVKVGVSNSLDQNKLFVSESLVPLTQLAKWYKPLRHWRESKKWIRE